MATQRICDQCGEIVSWDQKVVHLEYPVADSYYPARKECCSAECAIGLLQALIEAAKTKKRGWLGF